MDASNLDVRASLPAPKSAGEHESANRPGPARVAGSGGTMPARGGTRASFQRAFAANVSQALTSPDSIPRRSQYTRCSLVPCVKLSGTT